MSGGSWDYSYVKLDEIVDRLCNEKCEYRRALGKKLKLASKALHDIEWVDSQDYSIGDEIASIKEAIGPDFKLSVIQELLNGVHNLADQVDKLKSEYKDVGFDKGGNKPRLQVGDVFIVSKDLLNKMEETFLFGETLPLGEYVVVQAKKDGGGYGHGPSDEYPDGWHVFARRLESGNYNMNSMLYDFYQTGCFYRKIEEVILPVRKMRVTFVPMLEREVKNGKS